MLWTQLQQLLPSACREDYFLPSLGRAWRLARLSLDIEILTDYRRYCTRITESGIPSRTSPAEDGRQAEHEVTDHGTQDNQVVNISSEEEEGQWVAQSGV